MRFRISLGPAKCKVIDGMPSSEKGACEYLLFKLENLKGLSFQQQSLFPYEESETREIDGRVTVFSTYREEISEGKMLVVVQAFLPTWRFPNYFSTAGIGKIFVDALVINRSGRVEIPPDDLLYKYR